MDYVIVLEDTSDHESRVKLLESKNTHYMQQSMELEEELKKTLVMNSQIEMYKKQVQELQCKLSEEKKRADKAVIENKQAHEKLSSVQQEKQDLIFERDALKHTLEELRCMQLQKESANENETSIGENELLDAIPGEIRIIKVRNIMDRTMSSENSDNDIAGKKGRSDCTKNKLKGNDIPELPVNFLKKFRIIPKTDATSVYYCMWENTSKLCWLDSCMALVSHNHNLRYISDLNCSAQIFKVIKYYNEAVCSLNDGNLNPEEQLDRAKKLLSIVQESTMKYLQPILKNKAGDPESAFCALFNLITENKKIKNYFEINFSRSLSCKKCNTKKVITQTKPIITLSKVRTFQPSFPTALINCPVCKSSDEDMIISYNTLPQCIIFHFEGGAGEGDWGNLNFNIKGREYKVTGLITLKGKTPNAAHFVSWINEPVTNCWLKCNDLNPQILRFSKVPSECIKLEDVYVIMYETFDNLGTIKTAQVTNEKLNLKDEEDENIPFVDLSQEEESIYLLSKKDSETNYKKSTAYDCEPEELAFLQSTSSSENTSTNAEENISEKEIKSKITYIPMEQIEMLKQFDLEPKFLSTSKGITPRSHGQKNVDDEQIKILNPGIDFELNSTQNESKSGSRKSSRKSTNIFKTKYKSFVPDFGPYSESKIDSTKNKIQRKSLKNTQFKNKVETVKKKKNMDKNASVSPKRIFKTENVEQSSSESPLKILKT